MNNDQLMLRINQALAEGGGLMAWDDVVRLAHERRLQVWGNQDAIVTTAVRDFPRKRLLDCELAAGTLEGIWRLEGQIEAFAREQGCDAMVAYGRPGWGRVGRRAGWRLHSMAFVKNLGGGNGHVR